MPPTIPTRELPCPQCGYDLRATPPAANGRRCPECGTISLNAISSGIPWRQRRHTGSLKSFLQTAFMVNFRPDRLARELTIPAHMKDAHRFRRIAVILAALIAVPFVIAAIHWPKPGAWLIPTIQTPSLMPATVLQDRWYGLAPLIVGLVAANLSCAELYRRLISLNGRNARWMKRRLSNLGLYGSAVIFYQTPMIGLAFMFYVGTREFHGIFMRVCLALICLIIVITYLHACLGLVWRSGGWRSLRTGLVILYPALAFVLWNLVLTAINWAVGFVVMGLRSMTA